jgi:hypothetical protein
MSNRVAQERFFSPAQAASQDGFGRWLLFVVTMASGRRGAVPA